MILRIGTSDTSLDSPENFRTLSAVIAPDADLEELRPWAEVVGEDHLTVSPDLLIRLAAPASEDADWTSRFADMLVYAEANGWIDDAGRIRVHIDRAE